MEDNEVRALSLGLMLIVVGLFYLFGTIPAAAQYGGPPMWDRNPERWGPQERERRLPPPRPYGPQMGPCIYHGDCRGPRNREFNDPRPYPGPRYYGW